MKVPRSHSGFIMFCFYLSAELGGETVLYFESGEDAISVTFGNDDGRWDSMQSVVDWFQDDGGWSDLLNGLHR